MGTELDIDDVCFGHPRAERELMRLRIMLGRRSQDIDARIQRAIGAAFDETGGDRFLVEGAQQINGGWFNPVWGCDTMQHFIDALKDCDA